MTRMQVLIVDDDDVIAKSSAEYFNMFGVQTEYVTGSDEAAWYRIGDDIADTSIILERPKNSAIYVYNKYKDIVYSSHVESSVSEISLPQGGYIVFLGETGGEIMMH